MKKGEEETEDVEVEEETDLMDKPKECGDKCKKCKAIAEKKCAKCPDKKCGLIVWKKCMSGVKEEEIEDFDVDVLDVENKPKPECGDKCKKCKAMAEKKCAKCPDKKCGWIVWKKCMSGHKEEEIEVEE